MLLLGPFYILQQLLVKGMHGRRHQVRTHNVAFVSKVEVAQKREQVVGHPELCVSRRDHLQNTQVFVMAAFGPI